MKLRSSGNVEIMRQNFSWILGKRQKSFWALGTQCLWCLLLHMSRLSCDHHVTHTISQCCDCPSRQESYLFSLHLTAGCGQCDWGETPGYERLWLSILLNLGILWVIFKTCPSLGPIPESWPNWAGLPRLGIFFYTLLARLKATTILPFLGYGCK